MDLAAQLNVTSSLISKVVHGQLKNSRVQCAIATAIELPVWQVWPTRWCAMCQASRLLKPVDKAEQNSSPLGGASDTASDNVDNVPEKGLFYQERRGAAKNRHPGLRPGGIPRRGRRHESGCPA